MYYYSYLPSVRDTIVSRGIGGRRETAAWAISRPESLNVTIRIFCIAVQDEMTLPDIPAEVPTGEDVACTKLVLDVELVAHERGDGDKVSMKAEAKLIRGEVQR